MSNASLLLGMYSAMLETLGPRDWWPAETPFEVVVGAILTQNTSWKNVEKAIANLREEAMLTPEAIHACPENKLAELIRPAGYFNVKTRRLKNMMEFIRAESDFHLEALKGQDLHELRSKVLSVNGIGPETADAILLYALEYPTFVVDAYTFRMMSRHGLTWENMDYHDLQALFMDALPDDVALYKEYHALIVHTGKDWCKKKYGLCESCPLNTYLDT